MSLNSSALAANAPSSASSAGSSRLVASSSAARCTALGNTSLEDCPLLTWSLGCTPSPARLAMTSLAFMFDEVPEPVWKTSMGNWSSYSPLATRSPAAATRSAISRSSLPSSAFVRAAAALMRPSQRTTDTGTRSPETGKFATAFVVSPPQSCSPVVSCVAMEPSVSLVSVPLTLRPRQRVDPGDPGGQGGAAVERLALVQDLMEAVVVGRVDRGRVLQEREHDEVRGG